MLGQVLLLAVLMLFVMAMGQLLRGHFRSRELMGLLIIGVFLSFVQSQGVSIFGYSHLFVETFVMLALGFAAFETGRRMRFEHATDRIAWRPALVSVALHALIVGLAASYLYFSGEASWWQPALLFGILIAGNDLFSVEIAPTRPKRFVAILTREGTAAMLASLLAAASLLHVLDPTKTSVWVGFPLGVGLGILMGLLIGRLRAHIHSLRTFLWLVYGAVSVTILCSEWLGAIAPVAAGTLGLFLGHIRLPHKVSMDRYSNETYHALAILVIVFAGVLAPWPLDGWFYIKAIGLFALHILVRFLSLAAGWWHHEPDHLFRMALITPIGVPQLALALASLFVFDYRLWSLLPLTVLFFVFSLGSSALGKIHLEDLEAPTTHPR